MYVICYGIISGLDDDDLDINGPYYYCIANNEPEAEIQAMDLSDTKTKDAIIPRIFKIEDGEFLSNVMIKARDSWFVRWKKRTLDTSHIMKRDLDNNLCPFEDIEIKGII